MGKKKTETKSETKTDATKKPRKARAVMRSRKDSPAGHFADKLSAYVNQASVALAKVAKWPGVEAAQESEGTIGVIRVLNELAAANFVAPRGKGGRTAVAFVGGQKVTLEADAVRMLKSQFPKLVSDFDNGAEFFVSENFTDVPKAQLPIRMGSGSVESTFLGFVSRKWAQATA